jgi:hypothetical protein
MGSTAGFLAGTLFHELLHNLTGMTDPDIQKVMGIAITNDSRNITIESIVKCF